MKTHGWRTGASTARNLIGIIVLLAVVGAVAAVLATRGGKPPEIGNHEMFFAAPGSPEAAKFGATATLFRVPVTNRGPARTIRVIVTMDSGDTPRTIEASEPFGADEQRDVILSAGDLPPGTRGILSYQVEVLAE